MSKVRNTNSPNILGENDYAAAAGCVRFDAKCDSEPRTQTRCFPMSSSKLRWLGTRTVRAKAPGVFPTKATDSARDFRIQP